ncbi:MAG: hypothetical protein COT85_05610 [Chlamydiae bacterium CG10_big_fil_rev_8_21_14_0_10_42_34]|nr:MAG: hypothetical protein COT85_05610 [Chlamydiae bacterium CG10_big_fil_rev_8_21_14_0_10_42_34]
MKRYLKFWGTRGSCSVCGPQFSHFGGNTVCLEVQYDDTLIIIDAGTGIRPLGHTIHNKKKIDLFLGHTHWDHIIGFPFFEPLYKKNTEINIWAPQGKGRSCKELFTEMLSKEFFPIHLEQLQARLEFKTIYEKTPIQIGPITLDFHATSHPGVTYCFKIKTPNETISYVTDNEIPKTPQKSLIEFHKGADILIHEAQYSAKEYTEKGGWGHSPLEEVITLVNEIQPKRWIVTHHDPNHTDAELFDLEKHARSQKLPCPVEWIADGCTIPLK